jgi:hypothetical protein
VLVILVTRILMFLTHSFIKRYTAAGDSVPDICGVTGRKQTRVLCIPAFRACLNIRVANRT